MLIFQVLLSTIALVLLVAALIDGAAILALIAAMMLMVALSGVFVAYVRRVRRLPPGEAPGPPLTRSWRPPDATRRRPRCP